MNQLTLPLTVAALLLVSPPVRLVTAQAATNSKSIVIKEEVCSGLKPYRELDEFGQAYFLETTYEESRSQTDYECSQISYMSDQIPVSGYIIKPKQTKGRRWPVILYNRPGTGNLGVIDDIIRADLYLLANEGYVIVATNYRWVGERGRRDEWGGEI